MFRVAILKKDGNIISQNFSTKEEGENWILEIAEKEEIKKARIKDLEIGIEEEIY